MIEIFLRLVVSIAWPAAFGLMVWCYLQERKRNEQLHEKLLATTDANAATMVRLVQSLARPNLPASAPPLAPDPHLNTPPAVRRVMAGVDEIAAQRADAELTSKAEKLITRANANGYTMDLDEARELVRTGLDVFAKQ